MDEVKGQGHKVNPVSNQCTSFFVSSQSNQPFKIWPIECFTLKNTFEILEKKNWPPPPKVAYRIPPKLNQVVSMTRGILLLSFVATGRVVLTLLYRKGKFLLISATTMTFTSGQGHEKVTQYIPQTSTFFFPNI